MPITQSVQQSNYGKPGGIVVGAPKPIGLPRDPTGRDKPSSGVGTLWINTAAFTNFILCGYQNGLAVWVTAPAGVGPFNALTINRGNLTLIGGTSSINAAGNINAGGDITAIGDVQGFNGIFGNDLNVTGDTVIGGALTVTGLSTFNGGFDITSTAPIVLDSTFNGAGAIELLAGTGVNSTVIIRNTNSTLDTAVNIVANAGGIALVPSTNLQLGSVAQTGGTDLIGGFTGLTISTAANDSNIVIEAGTGIIDISDDAADTGINIGTGNAVKAISIGGLGANIIEIANTQTAGSLSIGTAMTTGTISIGSTAAQTGNFILAPGIGAQTITLGNNNGAKTISIGNGVSGNAISIGNGINTTAQTVSIAGGASAANSIVNILSGNVTAGTSTLNLATGTGNKVVHIADSAGANTVTLGSTNTTSTTTVNAGSGGVRIVSGGIASVQSPIIPAGASPLTNNVNVGQCIFTGVAPIAGAQSTVVITNNIVTANSVVIVTVSQPAAAAGSMGVVEVVCGAGSLTVTMQNFAAATNTGNVAVNFWVLQA